jgi:hypothetical protein
MKQEIKIKEYKLWFEFVYAVPEGKDSLHIVLWPQIEKAPVMADLLRSLVITTHGLSPRLSGLRKIGFITG